MLTDFGTFQKSILRTDYFQVTLKMVVTVKFKSPDDVPYDWDESDEVDVTFYTPGNLLYLWQRPCVKHRLCYGNEVRFCDFSGRHTIDRMAR